MNNKIDLEVTPSLHATFAVHLNLVHVSFVLNGKTLPEHFSFSFAEAERLGQRIEEAGMWVHFPVIGVSPGALKTFGRRLRDFRDSPIALQRRSTRDFRAPLFDLALSGQEPRAPLFFAFIVEWLAVVD